ncbi:MAG: phosphopantetheine-binding protein [Polaromonas sp.]|jgi:acyl carrier protein|nr:phosphopantetheine-binding protein [Polaromonas sp.]
MPLPSTFDRLCAILMKDYKLAAGQLTQDAPLEALGIDSLGVADLLFNVEDEFKIVLPPEPVALLTIGDVARYIDQLAAAQHVRPQPPMPPESAAPGSP